MLDNFYPQCLLILKKITFRLIFNPKKPNAIVAYYHFGMEALQSALQLAKLGSHMTVLDLRDAYYSVALALECRKYLRFMFMGELYQFNALPNGLACAPRLFTKLMKPAYAVLKCHYDEIRIFPI